MITVPKDRFGDFYTYYAHRPKKVAMIPDQIPDLEEYIRDLPDNIPEKSSLVRKYILEGKKLYYDTYTIPGETLEYFQQLRITYDPHYNTNPIYDFVQEIPTFPKLLKRMRMMTDPKTNILEVEIYNNITKGILLKETWDSSSEFIDLKSNFWSEDSYNEYISSSWKNFRDYLLSKIVSVNSINISSKDKKLEVYLTELIFGELQIDYQENINTLAQIIRRSNKKVRLEDMSPSNATGYRKVIQKQMELFLNGLGYGTYISSDWSEVNIMLETESIDQYIDRILSTIVQFEIDGDVGGEGAATSNKMPTMKQPWTKLRDKIYKNVTKGAQQENVSFLKKLLEKWNPRNKMQVHLDFMNAEPNPYYNESDDDGKEEEEYHIEQAIELMKDIETNVLTVMSNPKNNLEKYYMERYIQLKTEEAIVEQKFYGGNNIPKSIKRIMVLEKGESIDHYSEKIAKIVVSHSLKKNSVNVQNLFSQAKVEVLKLNINKAINEYLSGLVSWEDQDVNIRERLKKILNKMMRDLNQRFSKFNFQTLFEKEAKDHNVKVSDFRKENLEIDRINKENETLYFALVRKNEAEFKKVCKRFIAEVIKR